MFAMSWESPATTPPTAASRSCCTPGAGAQTGSHAPRSSSFDPDRVRFFEREVTERIAHRFTWDTVVGQLEALYAEVLGTMATLYPGLERLLPRLAAEGIAWGIATNKPRPFTEPLLAALAIDRHLGDDHG